MPSTYLSTLAPPQDGNTALVYASRYGKLDIATALVNAGTNVNSNLGNVSETSHMGGTVVIFKGRHFERNLQGPWGVGFLGKLLCRRQNKITKQGLLALRPIRKALTFAFILARLPPWHCWHHLPLLLHTQGGTALIEACHNGNLDVAKLLLAVPGIDLEAKNYVSSYLSAAEDRMDRHQWLLVTQDKHVTNSIVTSVIVGSHVRDMGCFGCLIARISLFILGG